MLLVSALTIAAAGLLAACGSGGEDSASTAAQAPGQAEVRADAGAEVRDAEVKRQRQQRKAAAAPSPDEQEAEQAVTDFYATLGGDEVPADETGAAIDSASFCELMSEEARAQTIRYAEVSSGIAQKWDCESAVDLLAARSERAGGFEEAQKAEVVGVNAEGGRATASVRFGSGPVTAIPMVKEDGQWKLAASTLGE